MGRLLAISTLPLWPIRDGYSLRAANLLAVLASRWEITLLAPGGTPPGVVEHIPLALAGGGLSYPWRFDNGPLIAAIGRCLAARPDRTLVWPGAESAWVASGARVPAVLDMIDCNPLEFGRAAWAGGGRDRVWNLREAVVAAVHARRAVRGFGATACVGEADAAWLSRLGGRTVVMVPNGVALPSGAVPEHPCATVVFTGTLDYPPNVEAVAFTAAEIWPRIRAAVPGARWVVAGRRPVAAIRSLDGREGVELRADVADMAVELQSAWVALAPMRTGVGLKNKVLEAWACARPAVNADGDERPPVAAGPRAAGAGEGAAVGTSRCCIVAGSHGPASAGDGGPSDGSAGFHLGARR